MTADLYVREGSRFVPLEDARPVRPVPPIPVPRPVDVEPEARHYRVAAPKCPHGSYLRWASKNCRPCARSAR